LLATGRLVNHYQPIVNLQSGAVIGLEVLARLRDGTRLLAPGEFLPALDIDGLERLLFTSIPPGLATLAACDSNTRELFISFNASPPVILRNNFVERFIAALSSAHIEPGRVTLEVLEDDEFLSLPAAKRRIAELHAAGIRVALDDVGTGYSSLNRLRELAVDKIKLDQSFVRTLTREPESLHFVSAMLSLARGLHNQLIVEGVETAEIMQALAVLGIEGAQGYAISCAMPRELLLPWLANHVAAPIGREPCSLLGAYAAHISIVEACRALVNQPLKFNWAPDVHDPHACAIGRYFDRHGLHDSAYGLAHKKFHAVIDRCADEPVLWEQAATALCHTLQHAIKASFENADRPKTVRLRCDAVLADAEDLTET
jgi:EAL domain-containing protein (putative c-di-GMP-specific phosphodiesterase class I)